VTDSEQDDPPYVPSESGSEQEQSSTDPDLGFVLDDAPEESSSDEEVEVAQAGEPVTEETPKRIDMRDEKGERCRHGGVRCKCRNFAADIRAKPHERIREPQTNDEKDAVELGAAILEPVQEARQFSPAKVNKGGNISVDVTLPKIRRDTQNYRFVFPSRWEYSEWIKRRKGE
jgi:hypothetical protein